MITMEEAIEAVDNFELMAYFSQITPGGRLKIAEELVAMINWPPDRPLTDGVNVLPYVEPHERLARLLRQMKKIAEWPGMAGVRGIYCKMYKPADGIDPGTCNVPGFTDEECESGGDLLRMDRPPEQQFIPGPDDEPIGELSLEISRVAGELTADRKWADAAPTKGGY